jgi:hypothetical protein
VIVHREGELDHRVRRVGFRHGQRQRIRRDGQRGIEGRGVDRVGPLDPFRVAVENAETVASHVEGVARNRVFARVDVDRAQPQHSRSKK